MQLPKVSIVTITYNHEKFIVEALHGFLMQNYNGPIEIIIANDNSPDNTDQVVKTFLKENTIPSNFEIKYTKHEVNKGMMPNFVWALKQATGKYIALCDGDDYWTDSFKIDKQVDLLEKNNKFSFVASNYTVHDTITDIYKPINKDELTINKELFIKSWLFQPLTVMFRYKDLDMILFESLNVKNDTTLGYTLLKDQKLGFYLKDNFGVYRQHNGGVYSSISDEEKIKHAYFIFKEIKLRFEKNENLNKILFNNIKKIILNNIDVDTPKYKLKLQLINNITNFYDLKQMIKIVIFDKFFKF